MSVLVAFIFLLSLPSSPLLDVSGRSIKASARIHSSLKQLQPTSELESTPHSHTHHHGHDHDNERHADHADAAADHVQLQSGMWMMPADGPPAAAAAPAAHADEEKKEEVSSHAGIQPYGMNADDAYPWAPGTPLAVQRRIADSSIPLRGARPGPDEHIDCVELAERLLGTLADPKSGLKKGGMLGVGIVRRATPAPVQVKIGKKDNIVITPPYELIWAVSGSDMDAGQKDKPQEWALEQAKRMFVDAEVNERRGEDFDAAIRQVSAATFYHRRATWQNTENVRNPYVASIKAHRGPIDHVPGVSFTFQDKTGTQTEGRLVKVTPYDTAILDKDNQPIGSEAGNPIGACAGAKIVAYLTPGHGAGALTRGDQLVCMAEINRGPDVKVRAYDGSTQTFAQGQLTASCTSCQRQIVDFMHGNIGAAPAAAASRSGSDDDEKKEASPPPSPRAAAAPAAAPAPAPKKP